MADAGDLKSPELTLVWVRVPPGPQYERTITMRERWNNIIDKVWDRLVKWIDGA